MEWSFNKEAKVFIELSFLVVSLILIDVDDVPLLVKSIVSSVDLNVSVFLIKISSNFNNLGLFIYKVSSVLLVSE